MTQVLQNTRSVENGTKCYEEFLRRKIAPIPTYGFEVDPAKLNPALKPFTRDIARWSVHGGRRAIFAKFGLHKTCTQLEIMRLLGLYRPEIYRLIVLPLGVRQEFKRDAATHFTGECSIKLKFIRTAEEIEGPDVIYLTNYESVREGILDVSCFSAVSLDEAAVLADRGSKTFGEFVFEKFTGTEFKFVATATPAPNEYQELLGYAAFLGICDISQARTRFFRRNSTKADNLTLHPHKEAEFLRWLSTWAIFVQAPSDLGYSDEGYELPPLEVVWHEIPACHASAGEERTGQKRLLKTSAIGVVDAAREKRESLDARVAKAKAIIEESGTAAAPGCAPHFLIWHDLEDERRAIEGALPSAQYGRWFEYKDGNGRALELYERHYSAYKYADGRKRELFCGPGEKMVLLTQKQDALFAWRKFIDGSGQRGVNCAVFRNEGTELSSELILEAMAAAWLRWPGERLYTYVNPEEIKSKNPGYCFIKAGWTRCGRTKGGLVILEALPGCSVPAIEKRIAMVSVYGSQKLDDREQSVIAFSEGRIPYLSTKPVIAGAGCNFQRHCHRAVYVGISFKFRDFIQSVHRIQRFQQTERVRIDLIYTEAERRVKDELQRKWEEHEKLMAHMSALIRQYGLAQNAMAELERELGVTRQVLSSRDAAELNDAATQPIWQISNNDAVLEYRDHRESNSSALIFTSLPFGNQYEYSANYSDFGHTDDVAHFWAQMDYLSPELFRVLQPGRDLVIHCKDRIVDGAMSGLGFQTVYSFLADCIKHFEKHGFAFLGHQTIVTDVVRENSQTYRLGWTEQCKDGSRMGFGLPEYLCIFRKPPTDRSNGYADKPVVKQKPFCLRAPVNNTDFDPSLPIIPGTGYSRSRWQIDAHGFARSNGNRLLPSSEMRKLPWGVIYRLFRSHSISHVYSHADHVALSEALEQVGRLPVDFQLLPPQSWHPAVWTDVMRARTLNGAQSAKGREKHLCPLQLDVVDRVIQQRSMPREVVDDPFCGIGTVLARSVALGRRARGSELATPYFHDSAYYCLAAEKEASTPTLFDVLEVENKNEDDVLIEEPCGTAAPGVSKACASIAVGCDSSSLSIPSTESIKSTSHFSTTNEVTHE